MDHKQLTQTMAAPFSSLGELVEATPGTVCCDAYLIAHGNIGTHCRKMVVKLAMPRIGLPSRSQFAFLHTQSLYGSVGGLGHVFLA